ncbi:unnamed protein product [Toxocara canis]|uniref:G_PROTEIN_RECEP_F1_2 domain-containing protein n=1 Tax=Toxocara canis TaxID=6265 RepID=A0A183UWV3_TOXCA|nr:unnamed protein product [Toxocara canis]
MDSHTGRYCSLSFDLQTNPNQCEFTNAYFIIISSLLSFFLPCLAMIAVYTVIFRRLRQRQIARLMRHPSNHPEIEKISSALIGGAKFARQMGNYFKYRADQILLEISFQTSSYPTMTSSSDEHSTLSHASPISESMKRVDELQRESKHFSELTFIRSFGEHLEELFPYIDGSCSRTSSTRESALVRSPKQVQKAKECGIVLEAASICTSLQQQNSMNGARRSTAIEEEHICETHNRSNSETVFLFCWVPFFTLHLANAVCMLTEDGGCVQFLAFFLTTWLGYFNSSLNPLIYTVFDQRFRKAFRQILHCPPSDAA